MARRHRQQISKEASMQSHDRSRCARIVATSLMIAAMAAPVASARPAIDPPAGHHGPASVPQGSPAVVASAPDNGFDWGSAGIGAGAGAGLVLVGAGSFALSYKARVRLAR
jgi:hypothetical protein